MQCPVLNGLMKAMDGEYGAIHYYEALANMAPNPTISKKILEIRKDEMRHYETFSHIYFCLTGQYYCPKEPNTWPKSFKEGIDHAFHDEQETVDFYHEMARNVPDPRISDAFAKAAADEQNHAVWFLYFMFMCKK